MIHLPMGYPRTIPVRWDQILQGMYELFAGLLESDSNVPCQFGAYNIHVVIVVLVQ
jgi:hypothetical protein